MNENDLVNDLKELIEKKFGNIVNRVMLFGSRAKGNNRSDSDYDILVIVNKTASWKLEQEILEICYDIELQNEIFIDLSVLSESDLSTPKGRQPFIADAFSSGIYA
jgi:predicted nucleotidyltransferase